MLLSTVVAPLGASAVPATVNPAPLAVITPIRGITHLELNGFAQGTTRRVPSPPDVGVILALKGAGNVDPLDAVHVSGTLHGTGFIEHGYAGGTITLSNAVGSITLNLDGPTERAFTPPQSGAYEYTLDPSKGTGAYAHDVGTGVVEVTLEPATLTRPASFKLTFFIEPLRL
jgi:hypothetical protein